MREFCEFEGYIWWYQATFYKHFKWRSCKLIVSEDSITIDNYKIKQNQFIFQQVTTVPNQEFVYHFASLSQQQSFMFSLCSEQDFTCLSEKLQNIAVAKRNQIKLDELLKPPKKLTSSCSNEDKNRKLFVRNLTELCIERWTSTEVTHWLQTIRIDDSPLSKSVIQSFSGINGIGLLYMPISTIDKLVGSATIATNIFAHVQQLKSNNRFYAEEYMVRLKVEKMDEENCNYYIKNLPALYKTADVIESLKQQIVESSDITEQPSMRCKLIITNVDGNTLVKKIASKFVSSKQAPFGVFHTALIIGPWYLEWVNSALCVVRSASSSKAVLTLDIGSIVYSPKVLEDIASLIVEWNIKYEYESVPRKEYTKNCQSFVDAMMKQLNISMPNFSGVIQTFLQNMRNNGLSTMIFTPSEEFTTHFEVQHIQFTSHKQLDDFVRDLNNNCSGWESAFKDEFALLKGFDRAFWLQHKSVQKREYGKNAYNICNCPFGDPDLHSIQHVIHVVAPGQK